jgi:hypothetical protein
LALALLSNPTTPRVAIVRAGNHFATIIQAGSVESSCTYTFDPPVQVVTALDNTVRVNTTSACREVAATMTDWIRLTAGQSQAGSHAISFDAFYNAGAAPRAGAVKIGNSFATIIQPAASSTPVCTVTASPSSIEVSSASATRSVTVTTLPGCPWTASESLSWVSLAPASGVGPRNVDASFSANSGAVRSGTMRVAGATINVRQENAGGPPPPPPSSCTYTVSPAMATVAASGGQFPVNVKANKTSCTWSVAGLPAGWTASPVQGTGSRNNVVIRVGANSSRTARTVPLTVGSATLTVNATGATLFGHGVAHVADGDGRRRFAAGGGCRQLPGLHVGSGWSARTSERRAGHRQRQRDRHHQCAAQRIESGAWPVWVQRRRAADHAPAAGQALQLPDDTVRGDRAECRRQTHRRCERRASDCVRAPASNAAFVRIVGGGGTGSGVVEFVVDPNDRLAPREARVTIAPGVGVDVSQSGQPPTGNDFAGRN